ncbi:MAG: electron transfer flavoprotein subunit beta/FixA family protein [Anaerolineae bacterium]|nr:electron transfer flavoprotein subunit beta/FixA family protein [Anaerolineae bacterium]
MHVVVITKATPDDNATVRVDPQGVVTWGDKLVLNPWDEYAVTEAVLLQERYGARTTVLTLGNEAHDEALKKSLAIGIQQAARIWDPALEKHDSLQHSQAMAAAIRKLGDVDLVLFGKEFTDTANDQHIYMLGRQLGWNVVGSMLKLLQVDPTAGTLRLERMLEQGIQTVSTRLPAVVSLFDDINEPRYPSFVNIRKASRAAISIWDAAELDLALEPPAVEVLEYLNLPERVGNVEMIEGDTPSAKAQALVQKLMEAKLL